MEPFVTGKYVPEWESRATTLSAISDYLIIRLRDDAFVHDELSSRPLECDADVGYRAILAHRLRAIVGGESLAFPHIPLAAGEDLRILTDLCSTLDYSEKIVISAAAFAIRKLPLSTELLSVLANILFEEAYHLKIITELLGLDQSARPWLAPDKNTNWELVNACGDTCTYTLLEHLLFEGRGAIAAAKGVHEAKVRGISPRVIAWLEKICNQETNHGILGLLWFHHGGGGPALSGPARLLVRRFINEECDDTSGTFRTLRQRYSAWLLAQYLGGTDAGQLMACLKEDVVRCKTTGTIRPTLDDISRSIEFLHENIDRHGDSI